jgi:hypothetical protein
MKFSKRAYPILDLVDNDSFLSLDIENSFSDEINDYFKTDKSKKDWVDNVKEYLTEFDFKTIHICYFAKSIADKILSLNDKLVTIYPEIPNSKGIYLFPNKTAKLFKWHDRTMEVVTFFEHQIVEVSIFKFEETKIATNNIPEIEKDENGKIKYLNAKIVLLYLSLYHFAEIETKIISTSSNQKKVILNDEKYLSDVKTKIEIVDSNWFTNIIRTTGFNVNGHFRLQPYGEKKANRKLIWIDNYEKKGYFNDSKD